MYTPTVYYWGRVLSSLMIQVCYPILLTLVIFFGLGAEMTFENFFLFLLMSIASNLVGCALAYMCGVCFNDLQSAMRTADFLMNLFACLSGGFANAGTLPPFIKGLSYMSPNRYMNEAYVRRLVSGNPDRAKETLEVLGYHFGDFYCYMAMVVFFVVFFSVGWAGIIIKNSK